jgi:adenine-specific DNA-methyltransferase
VIKYLGSKRVLLPTILEAVARCVEADATLREKASAAADITVLDLFSGTARVGHALKAQGFRVLANDHNAYAHRLAQCYVEADREAIEADARRLLAELAALKGSPGYFTQTFCEQSRYLQPHNGERVDAIREAIAQKQLPPLLEAVLLVSLMEAADRVDSTTGVQMAYLKGWSKRSYNALELRLPDVLPRRSREPCAALRGDAVAMARTPVDIVYLDPPYNQHSYLGNYHVWESLVVWDKPAVYGVACKRVDVRERGSSFNRKRDCKEALAAVLGQIDARHVVVSFNDEGYVTPDELQAMLAPRGQVEVVAIDYPRYVGARIGIYSPSGKKTGVIGKLRNRELLFVV